MTVSLAKSTRVLLEAAADRAVRHTTVPLQLVTFGPVAPLLYSGFGQVELLGGTRRIHAALLDEWYAAEAQAEIAAERAYELHLESPDPAYYAYCQANGW